MHMEASLLPCICNRDLMYEASSFLPPHWYPSFAVPVVVF